MYVYGKQKNVSLQPSPNTFVEEKFSIMTAFKQITCVPKQAVNTCPFSNDCPQ